MSDNERDQLIYKLVAETALLRSVAAFLCAATVPRNVLDVFIEGLDVPLAGNSPNATKFVHEANGTFISQVAENLRIIDKHGGE